jgi:YD repeat-containing protein
MNCCNVLIPAGVRPENHAMRKLFICFGFILLVAGCSKDVESGGKLSKILVDGKLSAEFIYSADGRLHKTISYTIPGSGIISMQTVRSYNDRGLLVKTASMANISSAMTIPNYTESFVEMVYGAGNRISEAKHFTKAGGVIQQSARTVYDYDTDGRLTAMTMYAVNSTSPSHKSTYQYNSDGNVIIEEFYQYTPSFSGLSWRRHHEYDRQKNPYRDIWVMPYGANMNNITKTTGTGFMPPPQGAPAATSSVITSVFKRYNSAGYPILVNEYGVDYVYEYR